MTFKNLINREFLYESKREDKMNKIFYKFDIKIVKKEEEPAPEAPAENPAAPATPEAQPVDLSMEPAPASAEPVAPAPEAAPMPAAEPAPDLGAIEIPTASVVTEDDDEAIEINDDNNIVRKLEGEITLPKEDVDNIQTVEDLVSRLTEEKVEGVNILDEFTADIIQVLANPATQNQISTMIDKKSTIFSEIIYGKKKEESIGFRIIKRKNSDLVTTTMLVDNKIINAPYKKETVDSRIVDIRNSEYDESEKK